MLFRNILTNTAGVLLIIGFTSAVFVDGQGDRVRNLFPIEKDRDPLFDSLLIDVLPEETAVPVLATIGLIGELFAMLGMVMGAIGAFLHLADAAAEFFRAVINAINRLFQNRRSAFDKYNGPLDENGLANDRLEKPISTRRQSGDVVGM